VGILGGLHGEVLDEDSVPPIDRQRLREIGDEMPLMEAAHDPFTGLPNTHDEWARSAGNVSSLARSPVAPKITSASIPLVFVPASVVMASSPRLGTRLHLTSARAGARHPARVI
jgi:hypothetical protein